MTGKAPKSAKGKRALRQSEEPVVVMESLTDNEETWKALAEQAAEYGWRLLDLKFSGGWFPTEPLPIGGIARYPRSHPLTEKLTALGCPVVRFGEMAHEEDNLLPAVTKDMSAAGRMGADHFFDCGFRDVGYLANEPFLGGKPIYDGFAQRAEELGMACSLLKIKHVEDDQSQRFVERTRQIDNWLRAVPKPIGVMTYSDRMATYIFYTCKNLGLTVPEDVAILGMGNRTFLCESAPVSLSSIDMNGEVRAREVVKLLHEHIEGRAPKEAISVPPKGVVTRRSTDVLAVKDATVAKAIRFLWNYLDVEISVDEVAEAVGISRRSLERRFRKSVGRSINEELRRKRLERCCELLKNTDLTLNEIVRLIGLRSTAYLHRAFRKAYGMSPSQYRRTKQIE